MRAVVRGVDALVLPRRYGRLGRRALRRAQGARLVCLVRHAAARVPFYRRRYAQAGFDPSSVTGLEDLERIPIVSRSELQGLAPAETTARGVPLSRLGLWRTSGSTGEPFEIRRLPAEHALQEALWLAVLRRHGYRATDPLAVVYFRPPGSEARRPLLRALGAMGLHRHVVLHCLQAPEQIAAGILRARARVVVGLAGALAALAETPHAPALGRLGVRFVTTGGQVLTPGMRRRIEQTFRAPVYDYYASYEFGLLASECRVTHDLHVCEANTLVEVWKDGAPAAPGEQGEVIATALHAFAVPFVRYRQPDVVTRGEEACRCGAPCATLRGVVGRQVDTFVLPDGRPVHPAAIGITALADGIEWIRRYPIVQERTDLVRLRVAARVPPSEGQRRRLAEGLVALLGPDVRLEIDVVDDLRPEGSGKYRAILSKLRSDYDAPALS